MNKKYLYTFLLFSLLFFLFSCSKPVITKEIITEDQETQERSGFVVNKGEYLFVYLNKDGKFTNDENAAISTMENFSIAKHAIEIEPMGDYGVLGVNRLGLYTINPVFYKQDLSSSLKSENRIQINYIKDTKEQFDTRTIFSSWSYGSEALFFLCRHPIFEQNKTPSSLIIASDKDRAHVITDSSYNDAYAVYPTKKNSYLIQFRSEDNSGIKTRYEKVEVSSTLEDNQINYDTSKKLSSSIILKQKTEMNQNDFEDIAQPEYLANSPESLQKAVSNITGVLLVKTHMTDGTRVSFIRGNPDYTVPAYAHIFLDPFNGNGAVVATKDWRISFYKKTVTDKEALPAKIIPIKAPLSNSFISGVSYINGIIVILWEESSFPDVGKSGLLFINP